MSAVAPPAPSSPVALRELHELPSPKGLPLIGNTLQIDAPHFHQQIERWRQELGPYFTVQIARRRMLVISDHEVIAKALRDRPDGFSRSDRLRVIGTELGLKPGVFGSNGEEWRRQRRMVMVGFDPAHVKGYYPSLARVGSRLAGRWDKAVSASAVIDLQADLMRFTVDTIAGLAFGSEVNTLESDEDVIQKHLDKIFPSLFKRMMSPLPVWRWVKRESDRQLERAMQEVDVAVGQFVAQARARLAAEPSRREHPHNLLEAMIVAADAPDSGITDEIVAGNVLTMLLAGEDTTANTIAWMIHLLWKHPQALARAQQEVRGAIANPDAPTFAEIDGLDYIEACAHETMRLKPVAPNLPLQATRDTVLGDVRVPAGTMVINMLRHDSVSERFVPNATAFEPERWLGERGPGEQANSAKRLSMPFGAGPRMCPGRYLALLEMKMAMAVLLGRFDITAVETPDGREPEERLSFTMTPVGLSMKLRARAA